MNNIEQTINFYNSYPSVENDDMMNNMGSEKFYDYDSMNYIFLYQERDTAKLSLDESEEMNFLYDKYSFMYDSDNDEYSRQLVDGFIKNN